MWRYPIALLLALHGLVHAIGVVVYWQIAEPAEFTYPTTLLDGRFDALETLVWVLGGGWLLATAGFLLAAAGLLRRADWYRDALLLSTLVSLILCILAMPEAVAGVAFNLAIAAALVLSLAVERLPNKRRTRTT